MATDSPLQLHPLAEPAGGAAATIRPRLLRVVGVSEDGTALLLAVADDETAEPVYQLPIDDRLRALVRSPAASQPEGRPALSVREVQARLRAGASREQVAREAGRSPEWVARFERPVLGEKAHIVEQLQAAPRPQPRGTSAVGDSSTTIGAAVAAGLRTMAEPGSVDWDSRLLDNGTWLVHVRWTPQGETGSRPRYARWSWDPIRRQARPTDQVAQALVGPLTPEEHPGASAVAGDDDLALLRVVQDERPRDRGIADVVALVGGTHRHDQSDAGAVTPAEPASSAAQEVHGAVAAAVALEQAATRPGGSPPAGRPRGAESGRADRSGSSERPSGSGSARSAAGPLPAGLTSGADADPSGRGDADPGASPPAPTGRSGSGRARPAVPAWDDILFGPRRPHK